MSVVTPDGLARRSGNHLDEPIQNHPVGRGEGLGMGREKFEQSNHAKIGDDGGGHQRADAKGAADFRIDTRIVLHILARDGDPRAHAFSGQPLSHVQQRAARWGRMPGRGAPDHFVVGDERQRGAAGSGELPGTFGDELQNRLDVVTEVADLAASCIEPRKRATSIRHEDNIQSGRHRNRLGRLLLFVFATCQLLAAGNVIRRGDQQICKKPFLERLPRCVRQGGKPDAAAASVVTPDHFATAVNETSGFRQIEAKRDCPVYFQAFTGLDGEAFLVQVEQLAEVDHHARVGAIKTGVHGSV